jgi:hypothetical protein
MEERAQEIHVKIWRNDYEKTWTVEVNGARFHGVTIEQIQTLFYDALLDAEEKLVNRQRPPQ